MTCLVIPRLLWLNNESLWEPLKVFTLQSHQHSGGGWGVAWWLCLAPPALYGIYIKWLDLTLCWPSDPTHPGILLKHSPPHWASCPPKLLSEQSKDRLLLEQSTDRLPQDWRLDKVRASYASDADIEAAPTLGLGLAPSGNTTDHTASPAPTPRNRGQISWCK